MKNNYIGLTFVIILLLPGFLLHAQNLEAGINRAFIGKIGGHGIGDPKGLIGPVTLEKVKLSY